MRVLNTNIKGTQKVNYALVAIKGLGRRFTNLVLKRARIDLDKRAGELTEEEVERIVTIISHPSDYEIPEWFLNRRKDLVTGDNTQLVANFLDAKMREDFERMKKMLLHRGLRHWWGIKVRGQKTKSTGRKGKTVRVVRKK